MISIITGRPGSGKSYLGTEMAWRWASSGKAVATNLPLRGSWPSCVFRLPDEEVRSFWLRRWRGGEWVRVEGLGEAAACGGVRYVIDEAHLWWSSRDWQQFGRDTLAYLSQHRKLGDSVVLITQSCGALDKAIRRLCGEYCLVRNMEREPLAGVRVPRVRVVWGLVEPENPAWSSYVYKTEWVRLNPEVFGRYDSFAGVGVVQGVVGGDNEEARRGQSWASWGTLRVIGLAALVFGVPWLVGWGVGQGVRFFTSGVRAAVGAVGTNAVLVLDSVCGGGGAGAVGSLGGGEGGGGCLVKEPDWRRIKLLVVEEVPGFGVFLVRVADGPRIRDEVEDVCVRDGGVLVGQKIVVDVEGSRWYKRGETALGRGQGAPGSG